MQKNLVSFCFRYGHEDEDEEDVDDLPRFRHGYKPSTRPGHQYQYVNSERDFTLPLQKHQNVQPMYESPEEGIRLVITKKHHLIPMSPLCRNFASQVHRCERRNGKLDHGESTQSSVFGNAAPVPGAPQLV